MGKTYKQSKLDADDASNYSDYKKPNDDIREKRKKKLEKQQNIGEDDNSDNTGEW